MRVRKGNRSMTKREIEELMRLKDWSRTNLASELDVTESSVHSWCSGRRVPGGPAVKLMRMWLEQARADAAQLERELHDRFSSLNSHGEWFHPGSELLEYIAANRTSATTDEIKKEQKAVSKEHGRLWYAWVRSEEDATRRSRMGSVILDDLDAKRPESSTAKVG